MAKRDYYEVLGVSKTASAQEIKSAYKKTAMKYHPDRQQGKSESEVKEAEEKFKEAAEAYDVLRDEQKRAQYDQFGFNAPGGGGFGGFSSGGFDMNDIFSAFGDIFGGAGFGGFGSGFGGGGSRQKVYKGSDLRVKVKLTLNEAAEGVTKKFKLKKYVTCNHCHGTGSEDGSMNTCQTCHGSGTVYKQVRSMFGMMQTTAQCTSCGGTGKTIANKCKQCHGEGVVAGEEIIEVNIPKGVDEGMVVNVQGKGNAGRLGGIPGDVQVLISIEDHKDFVREGQNLIYNLLLDFPTAALGGNVEIPTLDGKAKIKIEPGTQPGKVMRLRGKGLPAVDGYGYGIGDLVVHISIYVPESLNKDEKKTLEKLQESENFGPNAKAKESIFSRFKSLFD